MKKTCRRSKIEVKPCITARAKQLKTKTHEKKKTNNKVTSIIWYYMCVIQENNV